jgi:hypothetical protein
MANLLRTYNMFDDFINNLRNEKSSSEFVNQYNANTKHNEIATNNLKLYLNTIYLQHPQYIFIGEAPGHKGCRITGIPFTSEYILTQNYRNGFFGENNGYQIVNKEKPYKESTATIIWQYFNQSKFVPCFWNSFPFHPHKINDLHSNRKPNENELIVGKKYLLELISIFKIKSIISIGKVSHELLEKNNINSIYIRHPSNGGKNDFISGMEKL